MRASAAAVLVVCGVESWRASCKFAASLTVSDLIGRLWHYRGNRTTAEGRVEQHREGGAVGQHDADPVARPDSFTL